MPLSFCEYLSNLHPAYEFQSETISFIFRWEALSRRPDEVEAAQSPGPRPGPKKINLVELTTPWHHKTEKKYLFVPRNLWEAARCLNEVVKMNWSYWIELIELMLIELNSKYLKHQLRMVCQILAGSPCRWLRRLKARRPSCIAPGPKILLSTRKCQGPFPYRRERTGDFEKPERAWAGVGPNRQRQAQHCASERPGVLFWGAETQVLRGILCSGRPKKQVLIRISKNTRTSM